MNQSWNGHRLFLEPKVPWTVTLPAYCSSEPLLKVEGVCIIQHSTHMFQFLSVVKLVIVVKQGFL